MGAEVAAIWGLMAEVIAKVWAIPAILVGGALVIAIINAVKRGSNV